MNNLRTLQCTPNPRRFLRRESVAAPPVRQTKVNFKNTLA
jgi:hypothetical protein